MMLMGPFQLGLSHDSKTFPRTGDTGWGAAWHGYQAPVGGAPGYRGTQSSGPETLQAAATCCPHVSPKSPCSERSSKRG